MKVSLNNVGSLVDTTTAANTINSNNYTLELAFDKTLSRDGTAPNKMAAPIDMDSNQIVNLPAPATSNSPLRLQDLEDFIGGGTITSIPPGGTTGQALVKTSNIDYQVGYGNVVSSVGLALPAGDFSISNSPVTGTGTLTAAWVNTPTGTGSMVRATGATLSSPNLVTPSLGTPTALVLTNATGLPATSLTGLGTGIGTFLATPTSANLKTAVTDETGSGALVFATTPTLVTPVLGAATGTSVSLSSGVIGTATNNNAASTFVGEFISSSIAPGSPVALTTGVPANVTSISLTAGDWDVWGTVGFVPNAATTQSQLAGGINTTSATFPAAPGSGALAVYNQTFTTGSTNTFPVGTTRISIAGTTTVYLIAQSVFLTNTNSAFGFIGARRVR